MNIKIILEDLISISDQEAVGEYAVGNLEIHIEKGLPPIAQRNMVIHSCIEWFCMSWTHEKVEQLEEFIADGLDKLAEDSSDTKPSSNTHSGENPV